MSSKFKVGDLVSVKGAFRKGKIHTVSDWYGVEGVPYKCIDAELELVEEPKMEKEGTWVPCSNKEKKEWPCEHFYKSIHDASWVFKDGTRELVAHFWSYCPKCGAERPKEKETLEEIIEKYYYGTEDSGESDSIAKAIREHLKGKEQDITDLLEGTYNGSTYHFRVAKKILKTLGIK